MQQVSLVVLGLLAGILVGLAFRARRRASGQPRQPLRLRPVLLTVLVAVAVLLIGISLLSRG